MMRSAAATVVCLAMMLAGCQAEPRQVALKSEPATALHSFPVRPSVIAPAVKVFHQTDNTLTLVTKVEATDDEVAAILWKLRDAAAGHTFAAMGIPQAVVDARKPIEWFHVYRGPKCASEKYASGKTPCGDSYHAAGDFTLGSYTNRDWNDGELIHSDGSETQLWSPDVASAGVGGSH